MREAGCSVAVFGILGVADGGLVFGRPLGMVRDLPPVKFGYDVRLIDIICRVLAFRGSMLLNCFVCYLGRSSASDGKVSMTDHSLDSIWFAVEDGLVEDVLVYVLWRKIWYEFSSVFSFLGYWQLEFNDVVFYGVGFLVLLLCHNVISSFKKDLKSEDATLIRLFKSCMFAEEMFLVLSLDTGSLRLVMWFFMVLGSWSCCSAAMSSVASRRI